jgi:hypothetical protein
MGDVVSGLKSQIECIELKHLGSIRFSVEMIQPIVDEIEGLRAALQKLRNEAAGVCWMTGATEFMGVTNQNCLQRRIEEAEQLLQTNLTPHSKPAGKDTIYRRPGCEIHPDGAHEYQCVWCGDGWDKLDDAGIECRCR